MKHILFLICITLGVKACYTVDGDPVDTIKFSKTKLFFNAQGGIDTITSQGDSWWILPDIWIDGKAYYLKYEKDTTTGRSSPCCFKTEDGENVRVTKSDAAKWGDGIEKIEGPWFIVDKATKQMIIFTITPNEKDKPRELLLSINDRNFFESITVSQAAE